MVAHATIDHPNKNIGYNSMTENFLPMMSIKAPDSRLPKGFGSIAKVAKEEKQHLRTDEIILSLIKKINRKKKNVR